MATEAQKLELMTKVTKLVDTKYGGDWSRAFNHYAGSGGSSGGVERPELLELLEDADIGSWLTRGAWADGVMAELDASGDKSISWTEFQNVLQRP